MSGKNLIGAKNSELGSSKQIDFYRHIYPSQILTFKSDAMQFTISLLWQKIIKIDLAIILFYLITINNYKKKFKS